MPGFEFIDHVAKAYTYLWHNKASIGRLCGAVVLFKIMSFMFVVLLDMDEYKLRQGLFLLPSYFLEGWVIALILIAAINTLRPAAFDRQEEKRNAIASAIVYTLTMLALAFIMGSTLEAKQSLPDGSTEQNPPTSAFVIALFMVAFLVWSFRFLWLYIPVALGYSLQTFLLRFKRFQDAFPMIGIWLMSFTPCAIILLVLLEVVKFVLPSIRIENDNMATMLVIGTFEAVINFAVSLISSLAMAYAVYAGLSGHSQKTNRL